MNRVELTPKILERLLILPYSTAAIQAFSCRFRFRENLQRRKDISHDSCQIRNDKKPFHFPRVHNDIWSANQFRLFRFA